MKKNNKGFTLAELLIVVAIIAILVAVSIPMFTSQLSKAHEATNKANLRAAEAAAVAQYLTKGETTPVKYKYVVKTGVAAEPAETVADTNFQELDKITVATDKDYETIYVLIQDGAAPKFYPEVPTP